MFTSVLLTSSQNIYFELMVTKWSETAEYKTCAEESKILIPFGLNSSEQLIFDKCENALYKYHIIRNKWRRFHTIEFNNKGKNIVTAISINKNHQKLFMRVILKENEIFYYNQCVIYHIINKTIHILNFNDDFQAQYCQAIFTSQGLILFFINKRNKLFIYDPKNDKIKLFCDLWSDYKISIFGAWRLIYYPKENEMYIFGAQSTSSLSPAKILACINVILILNMKTKEYTQVPIHPYLLNINTSLLLSQHCSIINNKYILIPEKDKIYLFDMKSFKLKVCAIKPPDLINKFSKWNSFFITSKQKIMILLSGYMKNNKIVSNIPLCLHEIIGLYYCYQHLILLEFKWSGIVRQYKINLQSLVEKCV